MKKPVLKADAALILGKAAQHCKSLRDIFDALDKNFEDIDRALLSIEVEIDKQIDTLRDQA